MPKSKSIYLIVSVCLALSLAFIDNSMRLLQGSFATSGLRMLVLALALTISLVLFLYLVVWFFCIPFKGIMKLKENQLAFAIAAFLLSMYVLFLFHCRGAFSSLPSSLIIPVFASGFILFGIIVSTVVYLLGEFIEKKQTPMTLLTSLFLMLPLILAELMMVIMLTGSRSESDKFDPFVIIAVMIVVGLMLIIVAISYFCHLLHIAKSTLYILLFLLLLVSVVSNLPFLKSKPISHQLRSNHKVKRVIMIVIDTMRSDVLSCYGNPKLITPNIDILREDGVLFSRAFSASPWTLPATSSIMTGLSPIVHRAIAINSKVNDEFKTLAELLSDDGYLTGAIGSNPVLGDWANLDQGFDHYDFYPKATEALVPGLFRLLFPKNKIINPSTQELTDLALQWIDENSKDDFFLWLHYFDPHGPYEPPMEFLPNTRPAERIGNSFGDHKTVRAGYFNTSLEERQWIKTLYESELKYVDQNIGRFIEFLKKRKLYENSLIIITSDHGEEFWEHGQVSHGHNLYDELIKIPLIVKMPAHSSKETVDAPVSTESIVPTVMDICQIDYNPIHFSTKSLYPLLTSGNNVFQVEPIYSTGLRYYEDRESIIFDGFKYIRTLMTDQIELYDLTSDPGEKNSIAFSSPEVVEKAKTIISEHKEASRQLLDYYQVTTGKKGELDQERIRQLKSLGYIN